MSDRFRIYKTDDADFPWAVDYPIDFDEFDVVDGDKFKTFEDALAYFIEADESRCPSCRRGAVVDTDFGWRCEACGMYDVAVACEEPA